MPARPRLSTLEKPKPTLTIDNLYTRSDVVTQHDGDARTFQDYVRREFVTVGSWFDPCYNKWVRTYRLTQAGVDYAQANPTERIVRYHYPQLLRHEAQSPVTPRMRPQVAEWAWFELMGGERPDTDQGKAYAKKRGLCPHRTPELLTGLHPDLDTAMGTHAVTWELDGKEYTDLRDIPLPPRQVQPAVTPPREVAVARLRSIADGTAASNVADLANLVLTLVS